LVADAGGVRPAEARPVAGASRQGEQGQAKGDRQQRFQVHDSSRVGEWSIPSRKHERKPTQNRKLFRFVGNYLFSPFRVFVMGQFLPYFWSRNSICESRYRSFFHTGQVWPPESTCQTCGTFFSSSEVCSALLAFISVSVSPQEIHSTRSFLA